MIKDSKVRKQSHCGSAFAKIADDEEFQKQLLSRWGFTKDGGINCSEQLKIFSLLDWIKEHYR